MPSPTLSTLFAMSLIEPGQLPSFYDRVHHAGKKHAFFVQGHAAHHLGLGVSEAPFLNVDSQEVWEGYSAYMPEDGAFVKSVEAFAYSCCYAGTLLVALRLATSDGVEKEALEWLILKTDIDDVKIAVGGWEDATPSRPLKPGTSDLASIASLLRPHQGLEVLLTCKEEEGAPSFVIKHLELRWSDLQRRSLESFTQARPSMTWREKAEAAMTGRCNAFPSGVCQIHDAKMLQKRPLGKRALDAPYAVQLTFVAFGRFKKNPNKIMSLRVRHVYNPHGESDLWGLEPNERVRCTVYSEWSQVGSSRHHVLYVVEKVAPDSYTPMTALRLPGYKTQVDLWELDASHWMDEYRLEDLKEDLNLRRYYCLHHCDAGAIQILDDDDEDDDGGVTAAEKFMFQMSVLSPKNKIKNEVLKERLKETEPKCRPEVRKAVPIEVFLDPYAEACREKLSKLQVISSSKEIREEEPRGSKRPREGQVASSSKETGEDESRGNKRPHEEQQHWYENTWGWKDTRSWGNKRWPKDDWTAARGASRGPSTRPPPPPPPTAMRHVVPLAGPFCHLSRDVPHIYGEAASDDRLKPLVEMRKILETCGVAVVGRVPEFEDRMRSVVWDCLPHLSHDGSFVRSVEESLQECGLHPLETYGISVAVLAQYSREDVQIVFSGFSPAPVRLRSMDYTTLSAVPVDSNFVDRLSAWDLWMSALDEGPRIELFKVWVKELLLSFVNGTYSDSHGYHMPFIRISDLHLFSEEGGDVMAAGLMGLFKEGVNKLTFGEQSPLATLNACYWAVQYMDRPKGRVDLEILGGYLQRLNGVNRQFRKEALDLIVRIQDRPQMSKQAQPRSFDLGKVDFRYAENVALVKMAAPKWPFE